MLVGVWAEEVSGELPVLVAEEGGLGREEQPGEARGIRTHRGGRGRVGARQADVVLSAYAVPFEERPVVRGYLKLGGDGRWRDGVGVGQHRPRERERHGESRGARSVPEVPRDRMLHPVLHVISPLPGTSYGPPRAACRRCGASMNGLRMVDAKVSVGGTG